MVSKNTIEHKLRSDAYSAFVAEALNTAKCTTAVFINRSFSGSLEQSPLALNRRLVAKLGRGAQNEQITELPSIDRSHHIFVPFFGGDDARVALHLALQLAENPEITVTVVHYQMRVEESLDGDTVPIKGVADGKIRVSTSGDRPTDDDFLVSVQHSLPDALRTRVTFRSIVSYDPVKEAVGDGQNEVGQNVGNGGDLVILGRSAELADPQASRCLGLVADVMLESDIKASIIVVQARKD
jgi:hypothetical protein